MKILLAVSAALLVPVAALAAGQISGTNSLVVETTGYPTSDDSGYWMTKSQGVTVFDDDQFDPEAVECHGSGYWDSEGQWGEGICLYGAGDDTRASSWKLEKGSDVGQWAILNGTGKYEGISGQGTYTTTTLPGGTRAVSKWEGEYSMPE